jgi:NAD-binding of NADP-dependent 3-hydroxyisobutyrate dehydrogenase
MPNRLGDAFALVGKAGIDRARYLDILTTTLFAAPVYKTYGAIIAKERYAPPGFRARPGFKDIHVALGAAEALQVPMPVASLLRDRFLTLLATGRAISIGRRWPRSPPAMRASHRRLSLQSDGSRGDHGSGAAGSASRLSALSAPPHLPRGQLGHRRTRPLPLKVAATIFTMISEQPWQG